MKKVTYAVLGSVMVTTAVLLRTLGDGGSELMAVKDAEALRVMLERQDRAIEVWLDIHGFS